MPRGVVEEINFNCPRGTLPSLPRYFWLILLALLAVASRRYPLSWPVIHQPPQLYKFHFRKVLHGHCFINRLGVDPLLDAGDTSKLVGRKIADTARDQINSLERSLRSARTCARPVVF
jgi:hypothetical protein